MMIINKLGNSLPVKDKTHYSCQSHGSQGMMIKNKLGNSFPVKDKTHYSVVNHMGARG